MLQNETVKCREARGLCALPRVLKMQTASFQLAAAFLFHNCVLLFGFTHFCNISVDIGKEETFWAPTFSGQL